MTALPPSEPWHDLAAAQARELRRERRGDYSTGRPDREVLATDHDAPRASRGILDRLPSRDDGPVWEARRREADHRYPTRLIGLQCWTADPADVACYVPLFHGSPVECPGCGDGPLPRGSVCLVCHATADDPRRWPQQQPERGRDWDGSPSLAGGTGPAKKTCRKSRASH